MIARGSALASSSFRHSPLVRFGAYVSTIALALVVSLVLPTPFLPNPFVLLFGVVAISAWHGGIRPRLLVTISVALVAVLGLYLESQTSGSFTDDPTRVAVFALIILIVGSMNAGLREARMAALTVSALALQARQRSIIVELSQHALSGATLSDLLEETASAVATTLEADHVAVLELLPEGDRLVPRAGYGALKSPPVGGDARQVAVMPGFSWRGPNEVAITTQLSPDMAFGHAPLLQPSEARSATSVRIPGRETAFGLIEAYYVQKRTFSRDDTQFLQAVAGILALAVEQERASQEREALAREQAARTEAESAEQRQSFLAETSALLASSLDENTTLAHAVYQAVPRLADWSVIHAVRDDGRVAWHAAVYGPEEHEGSLVALQGTPLKEGDGVPGAAHVLRTGTSVVYPELTEGDLNRRAIDEAQLQLLRGLGARSEMVVPLSSGGKLLGALSLVSTDPGRRFGPSDVALAEDFAQHCALALSQARLYRSAQEAIRARDRFLSIASHEIRTPIARLAGNVEVLQTLHGEGAIDPDRLRQSLDRIAAASNRLANLSSALLDVSGLRTGQYPLRLRPTDVVELARAVVVQARERPDTHHEFEVVAEGELVVVADAGQMERVLTNLLENAVKYSPGGSTVEVRVWPDRGGAAIEVRDRGIGLPPGSSEMIFEAFERAENAKASATPGMGLGLYVSRKIVEQHGGQIWAENAEPGVGTRLRIWLPSARLSWEGAPAQVERAPSQPAERSVQLESSPGGARLHGRG